MFIHVFCFLFFEFRIRNLKSRFLFANWIDFELKGNDEDPIYYELIVLFSFFFIDFYACLKGLNKAKANDGWQWMSTDLPWLSKLINCFQSFNNRIAVLWKQKLELQLIFFSEDFVSSLFIWFSAATAHKDSA